MLIIGAIGLLALRSGNNENPSVDNTQVRVVETTTAVTSPETTPTTDPVATPHTTPPPTTVTVISPETQWGLDYVAGSPRAATGEPVRIGFVNTSRNDSAAEIAIAVDAATSFVNTELAGIDGRPIELVRCSMSDPATADQVGKCVEQMSDDSIVAVLVGQVDFLSTFYADMGATKPMLIVYPVYDVIGVGTGGWNYSGGGPLGSSEGVLGGFNGPRMNGIYSFVRNGLPTKPKKVALIAPYASNISASTQLLFPDAELVHVTADSDRPSAQSFESAFRNSASAVPGSNALDAEVMVVFGSPEYCIALPEALRNLGIDPIVIATDHCGASKPMAAALAEDGTGGDAPEGWYIATAGYNQFKPDLESGWLTYSTKLAQYASDGGESVEPAGLARQGFAHVMALVKIINSLGPDPSPDELKFALAGFTGPVMTQVGPIACTGTYTDTGFAFPRHCASYMGILQHSNGEWIDVADGLNGKPIDTQS